MSLFLGVDEKEIVLDESSGWEEVPQREDYTYHPSEQTENATHPTTQNVLRLRGGGGDEEALPIQTKSTLELFASLPTHSDPPLPPAPSPPVDPPVSHFETPHFIPLGNARPSMPPLEGNIFSASELERLGITLPRHLRTVPGLASDTRFVYGTKMYDLKRSRIPGETLDVSPLLNSELICTFDDEDMFHLPHRHFEEIFQRQGEYIKPISSRDSSPCASSAFWGVRNSHDLDTLLDFYFKGDWMQDYEWAHAVGGIHTQNPSNLSSDAFFMAVLNGDIVKPEVVLPGQYSYQEALVACSLSTELTKLASHKLRLPFEIKITGQWTQATFSVSLGECKLLSRVHFGHDILAKMSYLCSLRLRNYTNLLTMALFFHLSPKHIEVVSNLFTRIFGDVNGFMHSNNGNIDQQDFSNMISSFGSLVQQFMSLSADFVRFKTEWNAFVQRNQGNRTTLELDFTSPNSLFLPKTKYPPPLKDPFITMPYPYNAIAARAPEREPDPPPILECVSSGVSWDTTTWCNLIPKWDEATSVDMLLSWMKNLDPGWVTICNQKGTGAKDCYVLTKLHLLFKRIRASPNFEQEASPTVKQLVGSVLRMQSRLHLQVHEFRFDEGSALVNALMHALFGNILSHPILIGWGTIALDQFIVFPDLPDQSDIYNVRLVFRVDPASAHGPIEFYDKSGNVIYAIHPRENFINIPEMIEYSIDFDLGTLAPIMNAASNFGTVDGTYYLVGHRVFNPDGSRLRGGGDRGLTPSEVTEFINSQCLPPDEDQISSSQPTVEEEEEIPERGEANDELDRARQLDQLRALPPDEDQISSSQPTVEEEEVIPGRDETNDELGRARQFDQLMAYRLAISRGASVYDAANMAGIEIEETRAPADNAQHFTEAEGQPARSTVSDSVLQTPPPSTSSHSSSSSSHSEEDDRLSVHTSAPRGIEDFVWDKMEEVIPPRLEAWVSEFCSTTSFTPLSFLQKTNQFSPFFNALEYNTALQFQQQLEDTLARASNALKKNATQKKKPKKKKQSDDADFELEVSRPKPTKEKVEFSREDLPEILEILQVRTHPHWITAFRFLQKQIKFGIYLDMKHKNHFIPSASGRWISLLAHPSLKFRCKQYRLMEDYRYNLLHSISQLDRSTSPELIFLEREFELQPDGHSAYVQRNANARAHSDHGNIRKGLVSGALSSALEVYPIPKNPVAKFIAEKSPILAEGVDDVVNKLPFVGHLFEKLGNTPIPAFIGHLAAKEGHGLATIINTIGSPFSRSVSRLASPFKKMWDVAAAGHPEASRDAIGALNDHLTTLRSHVSALPIIRGAWDWLSDMVHNVKQGLTTTSDGTPISPAWQQSILEHTYGSPSPQVRDVVLSENVDPPQESSSEEAQADAHNSRMYTEQGNDTWFKTATNWMARMWNRLMHALNGNIDAPSDTAETVSERYAEGIFAPRGVEKTPLYFQPLFKNVEMPKRPTETFGPFRVPNTYFLEHHTSANLHHQAIVNTSIHAPVATYNTLTRQSTLIKAYQPSVFAHAFIADATTSAGNRIQPVDHYGTWASVRFNSLKSKPVPLYPTSVMAELLTPAWSTNSTAGGIIIRNNSDVQCPLSALMIQSFVKTIPTAGPNLGAKEFLAYKHAILTCVASGLATDGLFINTLQPYGFMLNDITGRMIDDANGVTFASSANGGTHFHDAPAVSAAAAGFCLLHTMSFNDLSAALPAMPGLPNWSPQYPGYDSMLAELVDDKAAMFFIPPEASDSLIWAFCALAMPSFASIASIGNNNLYQMVPNNSHCSLGSPAAQVLDGSPRRIILVKKPGLRNCFGVAITPGQPFNPITLITNGWNQMTVKSAHAALTKACQLLGLTQSDLDQYNSLHTLFLAGPAYADEFAPNFTMTTTYPAALPGTVAIAAGVHRSLSPTTVFGTRWNDYSGVVSGGVGAGPGLAHISINGPALTYSQSLFLASSGLWSFSQETPIFKDFDPTQYWRSMTAESIATLETFMRASAAISPDYADFLRATQPNPAAGAAIAPLASSALAIADVDTSVPDIVTQAVFTPATLPAPGGTHYECSIAPCYPLSAYIHHGFGDQRNFNDTLILADGDPKDMNCPTPLASDFPSVPNAIAGHTLFPSVQSTRFDEPITRNAVHIQADHTKTMLNARHIAEFNAVGYLGYDDAGATNFSPLRIWMFPSVTAAFYDFNGYTPSVGPRVFIPSTRQLTTVTTSARTAVSGTPPSLIPYTLTYNEAKPLDGTRFTYNVPTITGSVVGRSLAGSVVNQANEVVALNSALSALVASKMFQPQLGIRTLSATQGSSSSSSSSGQEQVMLEKEAELVRSLHLWKEAASLSPMALTFYRENFGEKWPYHFRNAVNHHRFLTPSQVNSFLEEVPTPLVSAGYSSRDRISQAIDEYVLQAKEKNPKIGTLIDPEMTPEVFSKIERLSLEKTLAFAVSCGIPQDVLTYIESPTFHPPLATGLALYACLIPGGVEAIRFCEAITRGNVNTESFIAASKVMTTMCARYSPLTVLGVDVPWTFLADPKILYGYAPYPQHFVDDKVQVIKDFFSPTPADSDFVAKFKNSARALIFRIAKQTQIDPSVTMESIINDPNPVLTGGSIGFRSEGMRVGKQAWLYYFTRLITQRAFEHIRWMIGSIHGKTDERGKYRRIIAVKTEAQLVFGTFQKRTRFGKQCSRIGSFGTPVQQLERQFKFVKDLSGRLGLPCDMPQWDTQLIGELIEYIWDTIAEAYINDAESHKLASIYAEMIKNRYVAFPDMTPEEVVQAGLRPLSDGERAAIDFSKPYPIAKIRDAMLSGQPDTTLTNSLYGMILWDVIITTVASLSYGKIGVSSNVQSGDDLLAYVESPENALLCYQLLKQYFTLRDDDFIMDNESVVFLKTLICADKSAISLPTGEKFSGWMGFAARLLPTFYQSSPMSRARSSPPQAISEINANFGRLYQRLMRSQSYAKPDMSDPAVRSIERLYKLKISQILKSNRIPQDAKYIHVPQESGGLGVRPVDYRSYVPKRHRIRSDKIPRVIKSSPYILSAAAFFRENFDRRIPLAAYEEMYLDRADRAHERPPGEKTFPYEHYDPPVLTLELKHVKLSNLESTLESLSEMKIPYVPVPVPAIDERYLPLLAPLGSVGAVKELYKLELVPERIRNFPHSSLALDLLTRSLSAGSVFPIDPKIAYAINEAIAADVYSQRFLFSNISEDASRSSIATSIFRVFTSPLGVKCFKHYCS